MFEPLHFYEVTHWQSSKKIPSMSGTKECHISKKDFIICSKLIINERPRCETKSGNV